MSCQLCETEPVVTYVRVENANVQIVGCVKHLKVLLDNYNAGTKLTSPNNKTITKRIDDARYRN